MLSPSPVHDLGLMVTIVRMVHIISPVLVPENCPDMSWFEDETDLWILLVSYTMLCCVSLISLVVEMVYMVLGQSRMLCTDTHILHDQVVGVGVGVMSVAEQLTDVVCIVGLYCRPRGFMAKFTWV